jgi:hypothetical protein
MQNFGKIKNAFYELLIEAILKKDVAKKAIFTQYIKAIKESKILKTQFLVYTNLEDHVEINETKATEFVRLNRECLTGFNRADIVTENEKLIKLLGKYTKRLEKPYDKQTLHETITDLIFTRNTPTKVNAMNESISKIVNYIKDNKVKEPIKEDLLPTDAIATIAVKKFNEKYSDLTEDERTLLKMLTETNEETKVSTQKDIVTECVKLIEEKITESDVKTKDKLLKAKDKLLNIPYDSTTYHETMNKLIVLRADLNN